MKGKPSQHKGRWVTLKGKRRKGENNTFTSKDVKRCGMVSLMNRAAKRGRNQRGTYGPTL